MVLRSRGGSGGTETSPTSPTVPQFGGVRISGNGTRSDPWIYVFTSNQANFNAAQVFFTALELPQDPYYSIRFKRIGINYIGAAGGVGLTPYAVIRIGGAAQGVPLGNLKVTSLAAELLDWECDFVAGLAPGWDGCIDTTQPVALKCSNYAATDDMYVIVQFEIWDSRGEQ